MNSLMIEINPEILYINSLVSYAILVSKFQVLTNTNYENGGPDE